MLGHFLLTLFLLNLIWDFNGDLIGGLPRGWQSRGGSARPIYEIRAEADGNRYLSARSRGSDVQLGIEVGIKPQQALILSWRWRAWELPRAADERNSKTLDSAASIYAVFGSRLFPRILKYVWSTSVPAGRSFKHPDSGRMSIIVVNSGGTLLGEWQPVTRSLIEDYKAAFGSAPGTLIALGVKTDSDSTRSSAQADYDDIHLVQR